jgi:ribosomal protein L18
MIENFKKVLICILANTQTMNWKGSGCLPCASEWTANLVDRQSGRVLVTASSIEKPLRDGLECGRACNTKATAAVGEVLAMRLRVDGLASEPIHAAAAKEVQTKGFKNRTKVWAILNALRDHGGQPPRRRRR